MSLLIAVGLLTLLSQAPSVTKGTPVSGVVVDDSTQQPIAGADVTFMRIDRRAMQFPGSAAKVVTDRDGRYAFAGLDAGRYRVMVEKTGYARLDGLETREVSIQPGHVRGSLNFALKKGAVVVGRVLDENGEAVVNAQVMVLRKPPTGAGRAAMASLFPAGQMAQTNDLGEFRMFGLPPHDEYFVMATARPFVGETISQSSTAMMSTFFPSTTDWRTAQSIALAAGQTSSEIVIRIVNVPAFQVSGVVIDESGRPVANAMVRLMPEQPQESLFMPPHRMPAHTDHAGKFTIYNATDGNYTLLAIAPAVISRAPSTATGGANGGSFTFHSGLAAAGMSGGVATETIDGVTTEYRDDAGTRLTIAVDHANVAGIEIAVRRSSR